MPDKLRTVQIEVCRVATGRRPSGSPAGWAVLNDGEWNQLLRFLDENGLTLLFRRRVDPSGLPVWVRQRLDGDYQNNCKRYETISAQQSFLVGRMAERGIEVAVLKGIALATQLYPDPCDRVQYDLDFYVEPEKLSRAVEACIELGYQVEPDQTSDHISLAPASASNYLWDGGFFSPDIPLKVELHDRLWDARYHIDLAGLFASPVMVRSAVAPAIDGSPGLKSSQAGRATSPACGLTASNHFLFIQLHFFRHLFQNQVRLSHLYEAVTLDPADARDALRQSGILRQIFFVNCSLAARLFGPDAGTPGHELRAARVSERPIRCSLLTLSLYRRRMKRAPVCPPGSKHGWTATALMTCCRGFAATRTLSDCRWNSVRTAGAFSRARLPCIGFHGCSACATTWRNREHDAPPFSTSLIRRRKPGNICKVMPSCCWANESVASGQWPVGLLDPGLNSRIV